ncbi:hypothetical protein PENANT_c028G06149 [Penicillium antarcticum]|uniref:Thymocyte nuclear protein 1 n=1 Tax=Penicillium antarcticum TaxID=416450 RepID=A0A1V6PWF7_9EURO|nr:uncharacterized protein N7508_008998 [Penicillium antarcticum]KAJ5294177.1 hypothetical protein N7508_008998 [Penicillium antarcticum]OQD81350.1 hypothetical protein PENANT_c028G06149 [Penicillium antarcticum]
MPPKRKPVTAPSATEGTATPAKRMRNSVIATPASAPAAQVEVTPQTGEKRGRGRPRKYPEGETPKPPASDGPKRGRGRPRKVAAESEPETEAVTPSIPKRGRGRPRKDTVSETVPTHETKKKDGRGRPRKEPAAETPATTTPEVKKNGRGRPRKDPAAETPATPEVKKKDGRGRPRKNPAPIGEPETPKDPEAPEAKAAPAINSNVSDTNRSFWLMKAEPESRMEKGVDVKFSIDDLAAATVPEAWDGVRNHVARKSMQEMKKGDYAFFYHSNCKTPGVVGVMEIVQESSVDESAFDTAHPYYDPKSKRESPKWVVVHVEYRRKLGKQVTLADLKAHAQPSKPLENMQVLKQSRLSVSSVTPAQWQYILELAGEEPQEEFTKVESS